MNGYEFTRFEADYTSKIKAQAYDADIVALKLELYGGGETIRQSESYTDAKEWFLETTMSCDKGERINWLKYYMINAIAYGIATKDLDWRNKYLAAYDIFKGLAPITAGSEKFNRFNQTC